jgi:hypothetical protein
MTQHALPTARDRHGCSGSAAPGTLSVEEAFELLLAAREEGEEGEDEEGAASGGGAEGLAARGGGRVASLAARRGLSESQLADLLKYHAPGARARPGVGPLRRGRAVTRGSGRYALGGVKEGGGAVGVAGGQRCLPPGCARRSRARPGSRAGSGRYAGVGPLRRGRGRSLLLCVCIRARVTAVTEDPLACVRACVRACGCGAVVVLQDDKEQLLGTLQVPEAVLGGGGGTAGGAVRRPLRPCWRPFWLRSTYVTSVLIQKS